jgi:hypothetical protein
MGSLLDALRSGIKTADKITKPLQATVLYRRAVSIDGEGTITYASSVPLRAIVDFTSKQVRTREGTLTVTRATIELLDAAAVALATNNEGIGNDDQFTLPDGDTGPILDIGGFVDAGTAKPIPTRVMLG